MKVLDYVHDVLGREDMDYALNYYSDFKQISDEEFHRRLRKYRKARAELLNYIGYDESV